VLLSALLTACTAAVTAQACSHCQAQYATRAMTQSASSRLQVVFHTQLPAGSRCKALQVTCCLG
jgi:hypothetical protein